MTAVRGSTFALAGDPLGDGRENLCEPRMSHHGLGKEVSVPLDANRVKINLNQWLRQIHRGPQRGLNPNGGHLKVVDPPPASTQL